MARRLLILLGIFFTIYFVAVINSSEPLFRYIQRHSYCNKLISAGGYRVKLVVLSKPATIKKHSNRIRIWAKFSDFSEPKNEYTFIHFAFSEKLKTATRNRSFVKQTVHFSNLRGPPAFYIAAV